MDILYALWVTAVGFAVGSFLNVVIWRVPRRQSIVRPPSSCPECGSRIKWYDNIPVVSYVVLRGRCRRCGSGIGWRYPAVELITGLLSLAVFLKFGYAFETIEGLLLVWVLIPAAGIDLEFRIIPNGIILSGLAAAAAAKGGAILLGMNSGIVSGLFGSAVGAGILLFAGMLGRMLFRRDSMGMGDVKLIFVIGLFLGVQNTIVALFCSFVAALVIGGGALAFRGNKVAGEIPFGPYIVIGALTGLFFGDAIAGGYLQWAGLI